MRNEMKSRHSSRQNGDDGGTEKKKLFEKSMYELREAFVKARFAQEDVFGRADIEGWLKGQREARKQEYIHGGLSDGESYWNTVLPRLWERTFVDPSFVTEDFSTHCPYIPSGDEYEFMDSFAPIFWPLFGSSKMYFGHTQGAIFVVYEHNRPRYFYTLCLEKNGRPNRLVIEPLEVNSIKTSILVFDILFAEWLYGRRKWEKARKYLCDALADEVKSERAKAEDDFNRAVAVSADGTKIVCADKVVVIDKKGNELSFPSEIFATNKILYDSLSHHHYTDTFDWFNKWNETKVDFCGKPQFFVRLEYENKTCFITSERFCPDPLPEGGVELKI